MDRLLPTLLVVGVAIAGLGAVTAVSIFDGEASGISILDNDDDFVDEDVLAEPAPSSTASPAPSSTPAPKVMSKRRTPLVSEPAPAHESLSGPRAPRSPGGEAGDGAAGNPPGSEDTAVGVGPDINDGQGLPANPAPG